MKKWGFLLTFILVAVIGVGTLTACSSGSGSSSATSDKPEYTLMPGTIEGNVYTNEGLGFKIVPTSNWSVDVDMQTQVFTKMSIPAAVLTDTGVFQEYARRYNIPVYLINDKSVQKYDDMKIFITSGATTDAKEYLETAYEALKNYKPTGIATVSIAGEDWAGFTATIGGSAIYGNYARDFGDIQVTLQITTMGSMTVDEVLGYFQAL